MDPSGSADGRDGRVFVSVGHDETRTAVLDWLTPEFEVVEGAASDLVAEDADVCLLDRDTLSDSRAALESAREATLPTYLPVLFVPDPDEAIGLGRSGASPVQTDDDSDHLIDDIVRRPLQPTELVRRLRSLLRIRTLSVELHERQREYLDVLNVLQEGVCLVEDGRLRYLNDAACRLLDIEDRDRALDEPFSSFVADSDESAVDAMLAGVAAGDTERVTCSLRTGVGGQVPVELYGVPASGGDSARVQLTVYDRRIQPTRRDRLSLFTEALDGAAQGITIADVRQADDPLIYVNETFTETTGYEPTEALGRNCRFLQGEETAESAVTRMREAIAQREPTTVEVLNYRRDGSTFWNRVHLLPVRDEDGTVTHYVGFQRDVTDRIQREQELERYRALVQAAGDPIYTLDADGRFRDVNDAFCSFSGYDRVDLIGEPASLLLDEQDVQQSAALIGELLAERSENGRNTEIVVETADGDRRLCSVSIALLPVDDEFHGTVGILRDITEPRGREQRLAVLERVLRHNLRNQTNVILSRAEHIRETESVPDSVAEDVTAILDAADGLISMSEETRRFRDVVTLQRQEPTTQDLVPLVESIVTEKRQAHETVDIETSLPETAPVLTRGRLRVALDELVENAISHHEGSSPWLSITVERGPKTVEVRIADDGPGIPESERCVADRQTEMPLDHASGLGLWLVRWTVEQSGGQIRFEDRDAGGAVVTVELPRAD
jgi:PAS domain S-box-containing protein